MGISKGRGTLDRAFRGGVGGSAWWGRGRGGVRDGGEGGDEDFLGVGEGWVCE
jgi:hypothetical protein